MLWNIVKNKYTEESFSAEIMKRSDLLLTDNDFNGGDASEKIILWEGMVRETLEQIAGPKLD